MGCGYQGKHFGASYEDGGCIDGYLWDLDSCDEPGGPLFTGGDDPCPQCNHAQWLDGVCEAISENAALIGYEGGSRSHPFTQRKLFFPNDFEAMTAAWLKGFDAGARDARADPA